MHRLLPVRKDLSVGCDHDDATDGGARHAGSCTTTHYTDAHRFPARMSEAGKEPVAAPQPPAAPAPAAAPATISIEDFQKIALKVGVVVTAAEHPRADRLLVLTVDIGEGTPRQIVAGIKGSYQPADLVGKQVVVVTNLKPAMLRGIESQAMILAASGDGAMALVIPERPAPVGGQVR